MRVLRGLVGAVVLALVLAGCASGDDDPDPFAPQSGGRLPDVTLAAFEPGDPPLSLRELRGPAVVNLWASDCGPCRAEMPRYQQFSAAYGDQVDVVGIDYEEVSRERAEALLADTGVRYRNFLDPDGALTAIALPQVVLVDESGEIAFQQYVEIDSVAQLEDLVREHLGVDL